MTEQVYAAHGLRIASAVPLPLRLTAGEPEVIFTYTVDGSLGSGATFERTWAELERSWMLRYVGTNGTLEYEISKDGRTVDVRTTADPIGIDEITLSVAMAAVLHTRGISSLHANAVVHEGRTILIAGHSGAGKSVTSVACVAEGAAHLSDDVCSVRFEDGRAITAAGAPHLRVRDSEIAALEIQSAVRGSGFGGKTQVDPALLDGGITSDGGEIAQIILLGGREPHGTEPKISRLAPTVAAVELSRNIYGSWLGLTQSAALRWGAELASRTSVYRVAMPDGLDRARAAARSLLEKLRSA